MKRFFFLAVAATCLLASCNKMETVATDDAQEISFVTVNKTATKAPVDGAVFSNGDDFSVAAFIAEGAKEHKDFFGKTLFQKETGASNWTGQPAVYWPLNTCRINFLAVTEKGGGVDHSEVVFGEENAKYASKAVVTLSGNACADQNDLMFAAGTGTHTQGGAYPAVPMVFKHALAWINFSVKTSTPAYNATTKEGCTVTVNSITLNEAAFNGTLTIVNAKYNSTESDCTTGELTAEWTSTEKVNLAVPGESGAAATSVTLTSTSALFGNGLLVIPDNYATSFTINYTLTQSDGTSNTYDYTYTLPVKSATNKWEMAKKYFYNINITLSEIEVTPSITDWDETNTSANVELN